MAKVLQIQQLLLRSRRLPWLVLGLTLAILGGAILLTTVQVRRSIREQIAGGVGKGLHDVALMEYAHDLDQGLAGPITDPGSQLSIVLKSSRLKGVLGVRLFDPSGRFVEAFPPDVRDGELRAGDLAWLKHLKPRSHFHPAVEVSELFFAEAGPRESPGRLAPLLEVNVPLHAGAEGALAGIAQFLIEGQSIAAEYTRLDRHLALQAFGVFASGGGILALAFGWASRRLRRAHQLLAERTANLVKANQELALAAKTSALGTVAAHLIHGLKNPLAGLQNFVAAHSQESEEQAADWQQAVASTRRMQGMISQVVGVLREEQTGAHYEVTLDELVELVSARVLPVERETGVRLRKRVRADGALPNRVANLAALVLGNLVQNALEATPAGKEVGLTVLRVDEQLVFEVADQGPGFPATQSPFAPCRSAKEGGSGIGLALSKQLANHLGASLELRQNAPDGCVFTLGLPMGLGVEKSEESATLVG